MADSIPGLYMIAYDISNPKRLGRVHRYLKKQGLPLQYSVFTVVLKRPSLLRLLAGLEQLIDPRQDDVRCYSLPRQVTTYALGRQLFPDDVMLFNKGINQMLH